MKNIQIPEQLFFDCLYLLVFDDLSELYEGEQLKVYQRAKNALEGKLDAMAKRELYTKYKTADTEEEREQARIEYLDKIGMRDSFRYPKGYNGD